MIQVMQKKKCGHPIEILRLGLFFFQTNVQYVRNFFQRKGQHACKVYIYANTQFAF